MSKYLTVMDLLPDKVRFEPLGKFVIYLSEKNKSV